MKQSLIFFLLVHVFGCNSHSQNEAGKLRIDKNLKNKFSDGPHPGTHGGVNKAYIDSILVYSTDSSADIEDYINADIRELNGKHFPFDTCKCFFTGDTLIIELTEMLGISPDKIRVEIAGRNYSVYFTFNNINKQFLATPESLVFSKDIYKKRQKILGEIIFQLINSETKKHYSFRGSFTCTTE